MSGDRVMQTATSMGAIRAIATAIKARRTAGACHSGRPLSPRLATVASAPQRPRPSGQRRLQPFVHRRLRCVCCPYPPYDECMLQRKYSRRSTNAVGRFDGTRRAGCVR